MHGQRLRPLPFSPPHGRSFRSVVVHEIVTQATLEEESLPSIPYCGLACRSTRQTHQPRQNVTVSLMEVSLLL
jgi:hypothetical protein